MYNIISIGRASVFVMPCYYVSSSENYSDD
jgi:hypothetical protein